MPVPAPNSMTVRPRKSMRCSSKKRHKAKAPSQTAAAIPSRGPWCCAMRTTRPQNRNRLSSGNVSAKSSASRGNTAANGPDSAAS